MPSRLSVDDLVANMTEQDLNSIEYGGYECAICMESDGPTPPLKLGCSHSFCTGCLRQYALSQLRQKACTPPPCPLCKRLMRTQEVASAFASEPSSKAEFIQLLKRAQAGLPLDVQPATPSRAPAARRVTRGRPFSLLCRGRAALLRLCRGRAALLRPQRSSQLTARAICTRRRHLCDYSP